MLDGAKQLSAIIKVTSKCTLACKYCDYMSRLDENNSKKTMGRDVLEKSVSEIMALPLKKVTFIWHGGEPLLAGKRLFEKAIFIQNQNKQERQLVRNNIQTNATLLNEEWVDFLKSNKINVGISIDGPDGIQNSHRPYKSHKGSFESVTQGIRMAKNKGLKASYLAVVTKDNADKASEIYQFFINNDMNSFDFLPCVEFEKKNKELVNLSINPLDYAEFLIEAFDLWMEQDDPKIHIRFFENVLFGLLGGKPTLCKFAGTCSNFITIDCNGDIYPCDKFLGHKELNFGNIMNVDLLSVLENKEFNNFSRNSKKINKKCKSCKWSSVCNGGCTYYRYMMNQSFSDLNYFCEANKKVFRHIEKRVKAITSIS